MNKNEKETLDIFSESFKKEAENIELPEALSKDNIVAMLKAQQAKEESEAAAEEKRNNIKISSNTSEEEKEEKSRPRKKYTGYIAAAAAFAIIIGAGTTAMNSRKPSVAPDTGTNPMAEVVATTKTEDTTAVVDDKLEDDIISDIYKVESPEDKGEANAPVIEQEATTQAASLVVPGVQGASSAIGITGNKTIGVSKTIGSYTYRTIKLKSNGSQAIEIISLDDMSIASVIPADVYLSEGNTFKDIIISGNTLALVTKSTDSASINCFNISDRSNPEFVNTVTASGSFVSCTLNGTNLCLLTNTTDGSASVISQSTEITDIAAAKSSAPESSVKALITVLNLSNANDKPSAVTYNGVGEAAVYGSGNIILATKNSNTETKISSISNENNVYEEVEAHTLDGSILNNEINIYQGKVRFVAGAGSSYRAYCFDTNLGDKGCANFTADSSSTVSYIGNTVIVSGSAVNVVDYSGTPKASTPEKTEGFVNSKALFRLDKTVVSVGQTGNNGKAVWSIVSSSGKCASISLSGKDIAPDTTREAVCSTDGNTIAIPVTSGGSNGYLLFKTDASGNISYAGKYFYESGTTSDASAILEDTLYIMTENEITKVLISDLLG